MKLLSAVVMTLVACAAANLDLSVVGWAWQPEQRSSSMADPAFIPAAVLLPAVGFGQSQGKLPASVTSPTGMVLAASSGNDKLGKDAVSDDENDEEDGDNGEKEGDDGGNSGWDRAWDASKMG